MAFQEIRHAFRVLVKNPGFTAVAALSLGLGIGANSAIFSLADALLLRPLQILNPSRVVTVNTDTPDNPFEGVSYPDYRDIRERSRSFDGLVAFDISTFGFAVSPKDVPQMRAGMLVSDNFFAVLGVQPVLGRNFLAEEAKVPGRDAVMILSHDLWRNQFAGDRNVIGRTIRLNGIDFTVVGVAPESFTGMDQYLRPAFYLPLMMAQRLSGSAENPLELRKQHSHSVRGRLKPGVSLEAARAELATVGKNLEKSYPESNRNRAITVHTELESRIQESPPDAALVAMLMALVGLVLIIACANVANLLLARARSRSREIAIRMAIGAGRIRLLRQLLTESLMLALLGGLLGLVFAYGGIRFLQTIQIPGDLPLVIGVQMDQRVLLFSLLAAVASALVFGFAPAWQATKPGLAPALRAAETGLTGRRRSMGRSTLVIGQVALAMVLLVAFGMLVDGFRKALALNPGFRTDHLMTMEFDTALVRYTPEQAQSFYRNLIDRARALPGVRRATLTRVIPFAPAQAGASVIPEGYQFPKGQESVALLSNVVDEQYFETMKAQIIRGRAFTADDKKDSRPVSIVNEQFAKTYWPGQDAVGKRLRLTGREGVLTDVVGVAKTGKYIFIGESPMPFVYLPLAQNPRTRMTLVVERAGDPATLAPPLRDVVRALDANQPVYNVRTLASFYQKRAIAIPLMILQMVATMGLLGLSLALIGLYGLIAYSVSRRTREIGIRMAIGADRSDVLRMVMKQGLLLSLAGIGVGSVVSFAVARVLTAGLAGIGTPNPATYILVPIALMLVTMAACYLPARRASLVDPITALRWE
ncbi:MAG: ABC transporter permease [Acidobacteriota bacterium]|nr:ABC transporter permease [Acidobacteriota bacterium]